VIPKQILDVMYVHVFVFLENSLFVSVSIGMSQNYLFVEKGVNLTHPNLDKSILANIPVKDQL